MLNVYVSPLKSGWEGRSQVPPSSPHPLQQQSLAQGPGSEHKCGNLWLKATVRYSRSEEPEVVSSTFQIKFFLLSFLAAPIAYRFSNQELFLPKFLPILTDF